MKGFGVSSLRTQLHRDAYALPCEGTWGYGAKYGTNFMRAFLGTKKCSGERKGDQGAEELLQHLLWFEHAESFYLCEVAIVECGHLAATL